MHWDAQHGKWVSSDLSLPSNASAEPNSPDRRKPRTISPARASITHGNNHASTTAGRKRSAPPVDDTAQTPVDDPDLPGWLVLQRTTNTGRSYKVYHGPNGEYAESKRQAVLLASGKPLDAAQLAFKSKPAPRGGGGYMGGPGSVASLLHHPVGADLALLNALHHQRARGGAGANGFGPTMAVQRATARAAAERAAAKAPKLIADCDDVGPINYSELVWRECSISVKLDEALEYPADADAIIAAAEKELAKAREAEGRRRRPPPPPPPPPSRWMSTARPTAPSPASRPAWSSSRAK